MGLRQDYYKFTHFLMPHTIFNYGRLFVYRLLRDEEAFMENLKSTWSSIELEEPELRNDSPNFSIEIIYPNIEHTVIIVSIPEATEPLEADYIGITYDENDNFRYFTYEIGKGEHEETLYFLFEWTSTGEHINYGSYESRDKAGFIKEISDLLVYDLL